MVKLALLFDWWFAGVLVIFYFISTNIFGWAGEPLEWRTYIFAFIIALLYFILNMRVRFTLNLLAMAILSAPFYIIILLDFNPSSAHLVFLLASVILWLGKSYVDGTQDNQWQNIGYLIYYFLCFHIASKLVYWSDFNDFIWFKVNELSEYYKYSTIIELIVPYVVLTIFFSSLILILVSLKKDFSWKPLKRYWWVIPGILFFTEAFSTSGYFLKQGGGAMYHWQPYVGVLEMMDQGGFLLWDTPSTYGFFSLITPFMLPFGDAWQKIYIVNGVLRLVFGFLIFSVIWNKRGLIWYLISIGLTLALVYYLPRGSLSGGAMRYFWVLLLMYIVVAVREKEFKSQVNIITPIWLFGFIWSVDSAFFVTAVLGPFILYHVFLNPEKSADNKKYLLIIPLSLLTTVLIISILYLFSLGHFPDYFAFIEVAVGNVSGYFAGPINVWGNVWVPIILLSWLLSQINKYKNTHLLFCIWTGLWAVTSYFIGQSDPFDLIILLPMFIYGIFLSLNLLNKQNRMQQSYYIFPLLIVIITMSFGNPKIILHIYNTFTNQDYTLKNTIHEEIDDLHEILTLIKPGEVPVTYIEATRYLNYLSTNQYQDVVTRKTISLSDQIWLPLHPASILVGYPLKRRVEYISRWLDRHPVDRAWVISAKNDHWVRPIDDALKEGLSNYDIKKRVDHGILKAVMYERIF